MNKKRIKQSTLNYILGGTSIFLSLIIVIIAIVVMRTFSHARELETYKIETRQLGFDFSNVSDDLTNYIRAYAQSGENQYYNAYIEEIHETKTRENILIKLKELKIPENELEYLIKAQEKSNELVPIEEEAIVKVKDENFAEARELVYGSEYNKIKDEIYALTSEYIGLVNERIENEVNIAMINVNTLTLIMITLIILMTAFCIINLFLSHFKIIKPIVKIKDGMMALAQGDLSYAIDMPVDNTEIGQLAGASISAMDNLNEIIQETSHVLTEMSKGNLVLEITRDYRGDFEEIKRTLTLIIDSFNTVLRDVKTASEQVTAAASQVSSSSMLLSEGATNQASSVEELTASLEQISAQTQLNANNANNADELSISAMKSVIEGNELMEEMLVSMNEINESSGNISKIIKVIDEIAFQTNILALNAAVEAARAGQHGKGFAVVADEVRTLAARSAAAASETTEMIESSINKTEEGSKIAKQTANSLKKIVVEIEEVARIVKNISIASNEQSLGIGQINLGINQVSDVVQSNLASSQENAAASEQLEGQAEQLNSMVSKFELKEEKKLENLPYAKKDSNNQDKKSDETKTIKKDEKSRVINKEIRSKEKASKDKINEEKASKDRINKEKSNKVTDIEDMNPEVLKMLNEMNKNATKAKADKQKPSKPKLSKEIILSDSEFGKY